LVQKENFKGVEKEGQKEWRISMGETPKNPGEWINSPTIFRFTDNMVRPPVNLDPISSSV